jgi:hypothetical protein
MFLTFLLATTGFVIPPSDETKKNTEKSFIQIEEKCINKFRTLVESEILKNTKDGKTEAVIVIDECVPKSEVKRMVSELRVKGYSVKSDLTYLLITWD